MRKYPRNVLYINTIHLRIDKKKVYYLCFIIFNIQELISTTLQQQLFSCIISHSQLSNACVKYIFQGYVQSNIVLYFFILILYCSRNGCYKREGSKSIHWHMCAKAIVFFLLKTATCGNQMLQNA